MSFPNETSFYYLLTTGLESQGNYSIHTPMSAFWSAKDLTMNRYDGLERNMMSSTALDDETIIGTLYDPRFEQTRKKILGNMEKDEFTRKFEAGSAVDGGDALALGAAFMCKSFPETYFHPDIAKKLFASGKLTNPVSAKTRVSETVQIMTKVLGSSNGLGYMLAIACSHKNRTATEPEYYKADTVEFTLLTFSYFGASASGIKEDDWFFFWKVFGSMMGLPPNQLHSTREEAGNRMSALYQQCPEHPVIESTKLLDVFIECFLDGEDLIEDAQRQGLISTRLARYLNVKGKWPKNLAMPT